MKGGVDVPENVQVFKNLSLALVDLGRHHLYEPVSVEVHG